MLKYHKYISFLLAVLFLVALQEFASPVPVFRYIAPAFLALVLVVTAYNSWYLSALKKFNWYLLVRPVLLLASGFGIFLIIPNSLLRGWFLLLMLVLITFFEIFLGNFAENVVLNETLIIVFGFFVSLAAYNQYFPTFHTFYLAGVFFASLLPTRSLFEFIPEPPRYKNISAVAIALFCTEIFWALTFLPFHYSALALLLFNVFYFFLVLTYYAAYNTLNVKKLQFHSTLAIIVAVWILLLTPWKTLQ